MRKLTSSLLALGMLLVNASPAFAAERVKDLVYSFCKREFNDRIAHEKAAFYTPLIERVAKKHRLSPRLVASVIWWESNYHPTMVSPAGARGLMQVMPFWFKHGQSWRDPATNLDVGCRLLVDYHNRFGDWHRALTAYCYGAGPVSRGMRRSRYSKRVLTTSL